MELVEERGAGCYWWGDVRWKGGYGGVLGSVEGEMRGLGYGGWEGLEEAGSW